MSAERKHESDELLSRVQSLIIKSNTLESIKEFFNNDNVGKHYFNKARDEVLSNNNQSYSSMVLLALESMSERIQDITEYDYDSNLEKLTNEIFTLRAQNTELKNKISNIKNII